LSAKHTNFFVIHFFIDLLLQYLCRSIVTVTQK
jgi:hypothetical protein